MRCAVIGAGSWGTALGSLLAGKAWPVTLWDIDTDVLADLAAGHNARYLPGIELPVSLTGQADLATAVTGAELVVLAVPSPVVRTVAEQIAAASGAGRAGLLRRQGHRGGHAADDERGARRGAAVRRCTRA